MPEEVFKLVQIMKALTGVKDKVESETTKKMIQDIIMDIKTVAEILNY